MFVAYVQRRGYNIEYLGYTLSIMRSLRGPVMRIQFEHMEIEICAGKK